jgi:hypothetical protein
LYFFFPCFHCLVLWEETTSAFYSDIRGACLMCLNSLLSSLGGSLIKPWISNQLLCKTETLYIYMSVDMCISQTDCPLDLYKNNIINYFHCSSLFVSRLH